MRLDELEAVCRDAAQGLLEREGRPLPAAVVLPLEQATRVLTLADFPDEDPPRFDLMHRFAEEEMRPVNASCYGFLAEAGVRSDAGTIDVCVAVYGARGHRPRIMAATLADDGLGTWGPAEELAPGAMPFIGPLQHAADAALPPDVMSTN